jgi:hypothetical protein
MNQIKTTLFFSTFLFASFSFAQKQNNGIDTTNMDSFSKELIRKAQNWRQEDEPWTKLVINLSGLKIQIIYLQQSSHPFLAEYNRRIIFKTEKEQSDTINMFENTGGRTLFNLYFQESRNKKIIILEDNFGFYYYDITSKNYYEDIAANKMQILPQSHTVYLGRIDGESYPLKFIDKGEKSETKIEHGWTK